MVSVAYFADRIMTARKSAAAEERQAKLAELLALCEEYQKQSQLEQRIEDEIQPVPLPDRQDARDRLDRRYGLDRHANWELLEKIKRHCNELGLWIEAAGLSRSMQQWEAERQKLLRETHHL